MTLFEKLLGHTLITADNIWGLMGVMCIGVALSIFLEQKYQWASKVSGAIIALIMAMVLANLGVIPTNSALYDDIVWGVIVPMAIPLLLLQCNLSRVWKDTGRMLACVSEKFVTQAIGGSPQDAIGKSFTLQGSDGNLYTYFIVGVYKYTEDSYSSMFSGTDDDSIQTDFYIPLDVAKSIAGAGAVISALPARPEAMISTISLVEVSPSMDRQL